LTRRAVKKSSLDAEKASPPKMAISRRLLAWYGRERRHLPWRAPPGKRADPYRVWLSEIMLQQTTVATVIPYFERFTGRWPTAEALAAADLDEVLTAWQGLGYYARARNLHKCARAVAVDHGGHFPDTEDGLRALPGIGPYTAAAVAAIAFGRKATPVDGNIERVMARVFAVSQPMPGAKSVLAEHARMLTPNRRAGDFAQALMDLGATICTPRKPKCGLCPISSECAAFAADSVEAYPVRAAKRARPTRYGTVFWLTGPDGAVLLRRRPENGLLGGMMEFPSTPWNDAPPGARETKKAAPAPVTWRALPGEVEHTFTHFHLRLTVWTAELDGAALPPGTWRTPARFHELALPTVMKKIAKHVITTEAMRR
jgi:A/G-specific adenine glycosylase